ncbi:MAG: DUF4248 domain-containing protein [Bacteroidaceae bacterium]|nr:DUF4248 domain-containing protein [Bacteroidaceae bacterium]
MQNQEFRIRQYGRTELALVYFPHMTPQGAWHKLRQWLIINPTLRRELIEKKEVCRLRGFTPKQVSLIIEELGEP